MRTAVAIAVFAVAIPCVFSTFDLSGIGFGTAASTAGTAGNGLAITGLSVGSATLAGIGGLLGAIKLGGLLGLVARRAFPPFGGNRRGGRRGGRRGKRSIETEQAEFLGEEFIFESIAAMDAKDCGKRYICELAATPIQQLSQEEVSSLLLFQS